MVLDSLGPFLRQMMSDKVRSTHSLCAQQHMTLGILAYPIWVSWMIGEPELEGKQSSDIIFGVVAFVGCLQAFILADGKTGVLFIPDMEGPDRNYLKWSLDIYNGIFEIK